LEGISSVELATPPLSLRTEFQKTVEPFFQIAWTLDEKNANLRRTRDLLLPKLISGEVDVAGNGAKN
jgi:type I restriction enzyme S subunit